MPHYKDGTEAKVGDHVTGPLYNSPGIKAGTIVSITPGQDSCNAMVQFVEAVPAEGPKPRMAVGGANSIAQRIFGEQHGSSGPPFDLCVCNDYCETRALTKVG